MYGEPKISTWSKYTHACRIEKGVKYSLDVVSIVNTG